VSEYVCACVRVCACVCVCVSHTHTHTHIHTRTCKFQHKFACTRVYVCDYECVCTYIQNVYMYTCIHILLHVYIFISTYTLTCIHIDIFVEPASSLMDYGVATDSRIDKITGLFCRISSLL